MIGKYVDICNKKGIKIDHANHDKKNEKHGKDFIKFVKNMFGVSTSKKRSGTMSLDLEDEQMFFMTQVFLQQTDIQSLEDVLNIKSEFVPYISDELKKHDANKSNQFAFVNNVIIQSFAYELKDVELYKNYGVNPHLISNFCLKSCSALFMSDEQKASQLLENTKQEIDNVIQDLNKKLKELEYKLEKCQDNEKDKIEKEKQELQKLIENVTSSYNNIVNGIIQYQEYINFNEKIFRVFENTNKANEFNQQGKQGWLNQIEKSNFNKECVNNVEVEQLFKWNNDEKISEIAEINEKTVKIQFKKSDTDKEFKDNSIEFNNFLERNAIYSDGGRPATNFFALLNVILEKQNEDEKSFLINFAKEKLIELYNKINSKEIDEITANKLLLPFYALEQFKKLNENEKNNVVYYDRIEKFLPIYDKIINLCREENKDFDLTKIANNRINSIRNNNSKSVSEEIDNNSVSSSSARSDSTDSNNSVEVEDLPSEEVLKPEYDIKELESKSIEELEQLQKELLERNKELYSQMYDEQDQLIENGKNTSKEIENNGKLFDKIQNLIKLKQEKLNDKNIKDDKPEKMSDNKSEKQNKNVKNLVKKFEPNSDKQNEPLNNKPNEQIEHQNVQRLRRKFEQEANKQNESLSNSFGSSNKVVIGSATEKLFNSQKKSTPSFVKGNN